MFYLHVSLYTMYVQCAWKPKEGVRSPGTIVTDCCLSLCGSWEWNPGPLEEQHSILLTARSQTSTTKGSSTVDSLGLPVIVGQVC